MKIRKEIIATGVIFTLMAFFVVTGTACSVINAVRRHSSGQKDTLTPMMWVPIKIASDAEKNLPPELDHLSYMMPEWMETDLEKKVDEFLDGDGFPAGKLLFIKSDTTDKIVNPTQYKIGIMFSFAAENSPEFIPYGLFKVYLDDTDITDQIHYAGASRQGMNRSYKVFHVMYGPKGYLDASKSHNFIITIKDKKGLEYRNTVNFSIAQGSIKVDQYPQGDTSRDDGSIELKDDTRIPLGKAIVFSEFSTYIPPANEPRAYFYSNEEESYLGEINKKVEEIMSGTRYFPNDVMIFFNAECFTGEPENPPDLIFGFLLPCGELEPRDIVKLNLDGKDATGQFAINQRRDENIRANTCIGKFAKLRFLDPKVDHKFEIIITTFKGKKYSKTLDFNVPPPDVIMLQSSGVPYGPGEPTNFPPKRDKLLFNVFFTPKSREYEIYTSESQIPKMRHIPYIVIDKESILDPASWILEFEDGSPAPKITSIEESHASLSGHQIDVIIHLAEEIPWHGKPCYATLRTADGLRSEKVLIR